MAEVAEVTEQKLNPPTESQWQEIPRTDPSFQTYFENYPKNMKYVGSRNHLLFNTQTEGKFLFGNKNGETKHVVWEFNNDQGYERWWDDVRTTPEITQKVNRDLLNLLNSVNNFYPWCSKIKGFIIVGHAGFGMNPGHGEGMNINYEEIKHLIKSYREKNQEEIDSEKVHLAASMVHELTHLEHDSRGDDNLSFGAGREEIGPHIPQFLFDPENNHIFNRQLKRALDGLKSKRDLGEPKAPHGYDWAQYTALFVTADRLAEENLEIKEVLEKDSDPSKIEGLKKVIDLAELVSEDRRQDISAQFMEITNQQIIEHGKMVEDELGITAKLI